MVINIGIKEPVMPKASHQEKLRCLVSRSETDIACRFIIMQQTLT